MSQHFPRLFKYNKFINYFPSVKDSSFCFLFLKG